MNKSPISSNSTSSTHSLLFKRMSIITVMAWLLLFACIPLIITIVMSFLAHDNQQLIQPILTLENYRQLFHDLFFHIFLHSLWVSAWVTIICLLVAYPAAYIISQCSDKIKSLLMILMIVPFWTSSLIRTYGIMALIKAKGVLSSVLLTLGLIDQPLQLLYTNSAVYVGMIYSLLPFMVLPLFSSFDRLDKTLIDAARDLGASRLRILFRVIVPLSYPGIMAGVLFVFLPAMTLFYIPELLGGARGMLLGNLVENQFLQMLDWPGGAATSMMLTLFLVVLLIIYRWRMKKVRFQELL